MYPADPRPAADLPDAPPVDLVRRGGAGEGQARVEAVDDVIHDAAVPHPTLPPASAERDSRLSLASIDVMRALAALVVIVHHVDSSFIPASPSRLSEIRELLTSHGWLGVPLFFVISGFCIHLPYALKPRIAPREYLIRRLVRIWPPYAVALLAGFVAAAIAGHDVLRMLPQLGTHLGFLLVGRSPIREDNVVLWSIVVEVQLYVLYLAIRAWSPRSITLVHWTLGFFAFGLAYHVLVYLFPLPDAVARIANPRFFALARMGDWLWGALIADALVRHAQRRRAGEAPAPGAVARSILFIVSGIAVILASRVTTRLLDLDGHRFDHGRYTLEPLDAVGFAMFVLGVVFLEQRARAARPDARPSWPMRTLTTMGLRCYSLYLFHYPVLMWTSAIALAWHLAPGTSRLDLGTTAAGWAVIGVAVALSFIVAEIVYRLVERPSHQLARRLASSARS